ncbi:MAG: calcium/sodium antiporter [Eubacteriales bacterium]
MELFLAILLFIVGLVLIIKCGDFFVDAASWTAEISGIPNFIIGATIVSIATTLPELLVSVMATANGQNGMAIGNAVGSVTANTSLILALSFVFAPGIIKRKHFAFKGILMLTSAVLLFVLSLSGELKLLPALLLFIILAVFIYENIMSAKKESVSTERRRVKDKKEVIINILKFIFGAAGIVIGARLLVDNGTKLAEMMHIPEEIIGVTMIAIGTSLPELATAVIALVKKKGSLSIGNIIGANLIDMTLILPVCSAVSGGSLSVSAQALKLDFPVCILAMLIALVPTLITEKTKRYQGILLFAVYAVYIALLAIYFM